MPPRSRQRRPGINALDALIAETTVDCYSVEEEFCGMAVLVEERREVPFETSVLGVAVTVRRIELTEVDEIVAVVERGAMQQRISILELPLPEPPPNGSESIAAYRRWRTRVG